jgi:hypothetical protein
MPCPIDRYVISRYTTEYHRDLIENNAGTTLKAAQEALNQRVKNKYDALMAERYATPIAY